MNHDLYTNADADRPDIICDRNGEVVLGLCKKCGRGESELTEPCGAHATVEVSQTGLSRHGAGASAPVVPEGWKIEVLEREDESWLSVTSPNGRSISYASGRGSIGAQVLQDLAISLSCKAPELSPSNAVESAAQVLWHHFAPDHHDDWQTESRKAEYRAAAKAVLGIPTLPEAAAQEGDGTDVKPIGWLAGMSHDNSEDLFYRFEDAQRECDEYNSYEGTLPEDQRGPVRVPEPVYRRAAKQAQPVALPEEWQGPWSLQIDSYMTGTEGVHAHVIGREARIEYTDGSDRWKLAIPVPTCRDKKVALATHPQPAAEDYSYINKVVEFLNHLEDVLDDVNFSKINTEMWAELVKPMRHYGSGVQVAPSEGAQAEKCKTCNGDGVVHCSTSYGMMKRCPDCIGTTPTAAADGALVEEWRNKLEEEPSFLDGYESAADGAVDRAVAPLAETTDEAWAVGEFGSEKILCLSIGADAIQRDSTRDDFIRWVGSSSDIAPLASSADGDAEEDAWLIDRLSKLLAGVAVALKGPEAALHRHGYQDLPELAEKMALELAIFREREAATPAAAVELPVMPKLRGVWRDEESPGGAGLLLVFERAPTHGEMCSLADAIRARAAVAQAALAGEGKA